MGRDQILTPRAVEGLIADGGTIVIFQDSVLRLDSWLDKHPGGRLAILHMIGRDATDEITAYHAPATLRIMKAYRIGRKPMGPWHNMTPPIRGGVFRRMSVSDKSSSLPAELAAPGQTEKAALLPGVVDHDAAAAVCTSRDVGVDGPNHAGVYTRSSGSSQASGPSSQASDTSSATAETADTDYDDSSVAPTDCPVKYTDWAMAKNIDVDLRDYPSLDPLVQEDIINRYRVMHNQIVDEGLYKCNYLEYGKEMVRYSCCFAGFMVALRYEWYMTSAVCLGLFWHQIMFTAHDAGHRAITGNFVVDTLLGMFIADFCCGLSIGWWKSSHNVHHLVPNMPDHDPDIQNVPLFATCPSFFKSISSSYYGGFVFAWDAVADFMVPYQKYTYYPIMGIARFNLYLLSWLHVLGNKITLGGSKAWWIRPTEIGFMTCYWFLFGYCLLWRTLPTWTLRVAFVLVSHIITSPLHVQITLSHWGMSTAVLDESESFAQRQLRTTMDVDCPAWLDFIHGGLQFQAAHHLFPRVPRHNLRKVQALAMKFSEDVGIPYSVLSFLDGNQKVISRLGEVGEQVKILVKCQKYMAETGESGLH